MRRPLALALVVPLLLVAGAAPAAPPRTAIDARTALDIARQQERNARTRGERLERQAAAARAGSDKARGQIAALAARVQQSEAAQAAAEARLALVRQERGALDARLARQRAPLARLVGSLETLSRRPALLTLFQPGSLTDLVHTRAVLNSAAPLVERRTRALRGALARQQLLEREAATALAERRSATTLLERQRRDLASLAEGQRLAARRAAGAAGREATRALELAEEARDLDALATGLAQRSGLRARLEALPGPILRPADPASPRLPAPLEAPHSAAAPMPYQLPVDGRLRGGFGDGVADGTRRAGVALEVRSGAQIVAPGGGRIVFAGPYRGYGRIVIVEHGGGWTSLVTGLASLNVVVGQQVAAGGPLGRAGTQPVTLELRSEGRLVNPLDHLR